MSLEERTLVVRNIDGDKLTTDLLEELFANFGPVVNIVLRKQFAFVEYTKKESVGYALAMLEGVFLQGRKLRLLPKLPNDSSYYLYRDMLDNFEQKILDEPNFIENFITPEQKKEKEELLKKLNESNSNYSSIRNRLNRYYRHYEPRSTFNPILRRDLSNSNNVHSSSSSRSSPVSSSDWHRHSSPVETNSNHYRNHRNDHSNRYHDSTYNSEPIYGGYRDDGGHGSYHNRSYSSWNNSIGHDDHWHSSYRSNSHHPYRDDGHGEHYYRTPPPPPPPAQQNPHYPQNNRKRYSSPYGNGRPSHY